MKKTEFTIILEELRKMHGISYKHLAEQLGYSSTYVFDIANGNRVPTKDIAEKIVLIFNLPADGKRALYDAIARSTDNLPYDVIDFLKNNPEELNGIIELMNNHKLSKSINTR